MSTRRPWITADQRVSWFGADCQTEVRFDPDGISRIQRGEEVDRFPWAQVADLEIKVPYAPPWLWRLGVVGNLISEDDQKRKLERVVETARQVWGHG